MFPGSFAIVTGLKVDWSFLGQLANQFVMNHEDGKECWNQEIMAEKTKNPLESVFSYRGYLHAPDA